MWRASNVGYLLTASGSMISAGLPVFMTGGLAPLAAGELGLSRADLGLVVSVFYVASSVTSFPAGRLTEGVSCIAGIRTAALLSIGSSLGMATVVDDIVSLTLFMVMGGIAFGVAIPSNNTVLALGIPIRWHGLAFGIMQSSLPATALVTGMAIPLVALALGWRWAFVASAAFSLTVLLMSLPIRLSEVGSRSGGINLTEFDDEEAARLPLVKLVLIAGFGVAATTAMSVFLVEALVSTGVSESAAGVLFAIGGSSGVISRIVVGWRAGGTRKSQLPVIAGMSLLGAVGIAFLAISPSEVWLLALSTGMAFAMGWGWSGLLYLVVVHAFPLSTSASTGIVATGAHVGAVVGPVVFGVIAQYLSFQWAWALAALWLTIAGTLAWAVRSL